MGARGLECEQKTKSTNPLLEKRKEKHLKSGINQKNEMQYSKLRHGKCI